MTQDPIRHFVVLKLLGKERDINISRTTSAVIVSGSPRYIAEKIYRSGDEPTF